MTPGDLIAPEWFAEATRFYAEKHQACPWCGGAYCVYRSEHGQVIEYHCGTCDFLACHERETGRYFMGPGEERRGPLTMHAV